ncbi:MAG: transcription termination factor Rho [Tissierellia bacterium]|nr:transcription termination factor Rho [Tissierellia bacterium]
MGLTPEESFTRQDYYNFITKGHRPEEKRSFTSYTKKELESKTILQLREIANSIDIKQAYKYKKSELIDQILSNQPNKNDPTKSLDQYTMAQLREQAKHLGIEEPYHYKKNQLIQLIEDHHEFDGEYSDLPQREELEEEIEEHKVVKELGIEMEDLSDNATEIVEKIEDANYVQGILDLHTDGYGFLRTSNYLPGEGDIYVSPSQIRRFRLRNGDKVMGIVRPSKPGESFNALIYIKNVNDKNPDDMINRPYFDNLTPIYPKEKITLEDRSGDLTTRIIDLISPIGRGQRGLIVSQPKSGKTTLLKKIASSIERNYPDLKLIVLLIDERPEEVTDMQRSVKGEVVYSTFDETPKNHTRVAEMVIDRAKRLVEQKEDVVILLDSLTRLSRAYNLITPSSGKTLSGGLDPLSLHKPKRFFGAARNIEEGGSLTILATALIETGSRMDDVIFEEFKGTGNMELHLDRKLSERRIFPAIDIYKSGTRKEEFLLNGLENEFNFSIRNAMNYHSSAEITEMLLEELMKTKNNQKFLKTTNMIRS